MSEVYKIPQLHPPNKVVNTYVEDFNDGYGHCADITKVDYLTKKKTLIEGFTLYVKWKECKEKK